jgi:hypothetical protein
MIQPDEIIRADDFQAEYTYECAEDIDSGDAVSLVVSDGAVSEININETNETNESDFRNTRFRGQSFTTGANTNKIKSVQLRLRNSAGAVDVTLRLRSALTGSDIASATRQVPDASTTTLSFSFLADVSPSTTYYLVLTATLSLDNYVFVKRGVTNAVGTTYVSTDSGASFSTESPNRTWYFSVEEGIGEVGTIMKSIATTFDSGINFIGFAKESKLLGENCKVNIWNFHETTGLTAGADYYLSDTAGAISTTAGTISRWIGKAESTTKLNRMLGIRKFVSPFITVGFSGTICPANGLVTFVRTGGIGGSTFTVNGVGFTTSSTAQQIFMEVEAGDNISTGGATSVTRFRIKQ